MERHFSIAGQLRFSACFLLIFLFFGIFLQAADNLTKPNEKGPLPGLYVNTFNGNLLYQRTDLRTPARGDVPIDLVFSYNSLRYDQDWGYGKGWSFSFGIRYVPVTGKMIIERGDGQKDEFRISGGGYLPDPGIFDQLTEYQTGKFLLTTRHGIRYYFDDPSHRSLTRIVDRNGNTILFTYTSGNLAAITSPAGRQISLAWTGGHLTQISDLNGTPGRMVNYQYDASGYLVNVTNPASFQMIYGYNGSGQLSSITDYRGTVCQISYDVNRAVASVACPVIPTLKTFAYNGATRVTSVAETVSSLVRTTLYTFDLSGRVSRIDYPGGGFVTYSWDAQNNLIQYADELGSVTSYTYDGRGNRLSETDCRSNTRAWTYDPIFNLVTTFTDRRGSVTTYTYDINGNLTRKTDCLGNFESYVADVFGNTTSVTDMNGYVTTYAYNVHGRITAMTNARGYTDSWTYSEYGEILTHTNKRGFTESSVYDILGRPVTYQNFAGVAKQFTYDPNGNITLVTEALGRNTSYVYSALNLEASRTDALGGIRTRTWDAAGNLVAETNETGCTTLYAYDGRNRLTTTQDCLGYTEVITYDLAGRQLSFTDRNGKTTTYTRSCLGDILTETDALGKTTTSVYDPVSNLISQTDRRGKTYTFSYTCTNLRSSSTDPLGFTMQSFFDPGGRLVESKDQNSKSTFYAYDGCNMISKTNALGIVESYGYDAGNNRISLTDGNGNVWITTYNALNQPTQYTNPLGGIKSYSYDLLSRVISETDENGHTRSRTYNANNLITTRTNALGGVTTDLYDPAGYRISETNPGGATTIYGYDAMHRNTSVSNALGFTKSYTYDGNGSELTFTDEAGNVTSRTWDPLGRLLTVTNPLGGISTNTWDNEGNLLSFTDEVGNITTNAYDAANRLTSETNAAGGTTTYVKDPAGQLVSSTDPLGGVISFTYDDIYRRISRTNELGLTRSYVYDNNNNLLSETDEGGLVTAYLYDALNRCTRITQPSGAYTNLVYDNAGNLVSKTEPNGVTTTFIYDAGNFLISQFTSSKSTASGSVYYERNANHAITTYRRNAPAKSSGSYSLGPGEISLTLNIMDKPISKTAMYHDGFSLTANYTLNPTGEPIRITGLGNDTLQRMYEHCLLSSLTFKGKTVSFTHDVKARVTGAQYPGHSWNFGWHPLDMVNDYTLTLTNEYDTLLGMSRCINHFSTVTSIDYRNGNTMSMTYNGAHQNTGYSYFDQAMNLTTNVTYSRSPSGWVNQETTDATQVRSFSHTPDGYLTQVVAIENDDTTTTDLPNDASGNRTASLSTQGDIQYAWNGFGQLAQQVKPYDTVTWNRMCDGTLGWINNNGYIEQRFYLDDQTYCQYSNGNLMYSYVGPITDFNGMGTFYNFFDEEGNSIAQVDSASGMLNFLITSPVNTVLNPEGYYWMPPNYRIGGMESGHNTGFLDNLNGLRSYDAAGITIVNNNATGTTVSIQPDSEVNEPWNANLVSASTTFRHGLSSVYENGGIMLSWGGFWRWVDEELLGGEDWGKRPTTVPKDPPKVDPSGLDPAVVKDMERNARNQQVAAAGEHVKGAEEMCEILILAGQLAVGPGGKILTIGYDVLIAKAKGENMGNVLKDLFNKGVKEIVFGSVTMVLGDNAAENAKRLNEAKEALDEMERRKKEAEKEGK